MHKPKLSLCTPLRQLGAWRYSSTLIILRIRWRSSVLRLRHYTPPPPGETPSIAHGVGVWVEPTAGLDILDHGQIIASAENRTMVPRSSTMQHVTTSQSNVLVASAGSRVMVSLPQTLTSSVHLRGFRGSFHRIQFEAHCRRYRLHQCTLTKLRHVT